MNFAPIIMGKMKKFAAEKNYAHMKESDIFERFVNYHIIYSHQPNAFFGNSDILENISMGGKDDTALDGFCIKVNGHIIEDFDDFKAIVEEDHKVNIEFIFIQAKFTSNTKMGEFNNFTDGIRNFFAEEQFLPCNDKVKKAIALKDKVLSDEYLDCWADSPTVKAYYVNMGQGDTPHTGGLTAQLKKDITSLNIFEDIDIYVVGERDFRNICDANDDTFAATLKVIQEMPLSEVDNVKNSCIILCYADEFIKLIKLEDGSLRKVAFTDNVRDFQGMTSINKEIESTIINTPESFSLFNNGITVVCDSYVPKSRSLHITNPQIVNGCQTSSVLYYASLHTDISKVPLVVKIIATSDEDITNLIVRGTNRQNIVYDESFEITRNFHKDLERYFATMEFKGNKIYYERRSKQFSNHPSINQLQKFSFKNIIQLSTATILGLPHIAHRHESILLKQINGKLFRDNHSLYAYFAVSILYNALLRHFSDNQDNKKEYYTYNFHILFLMERILSKSATPSMSDIRGSESFYEKLLNSFHEKSNATITNAFRIFDISRKEWVDVKKKSKFSIKEQEDFTALLVKNVGIKAFQQENAGVVSIIRRDIRGDYYGFIETAQQKIFFHQLSSPHLDWDNIVGKNVSYTLSKSKRGEPMATKVIRI